MEAQPPEDAKKKRSCLESLKMKPTTLDKICAFLGEVIGTGILVFLGCMGCIETESFKNNHLQMTLNFGLVVMVAIQSFACVSGAHINPAVTVAAYFYNLVNLPMAALYIVGQVLGAFIGYGLLKALVPESAIKSPNSAHGLCVTTVHTDLSWAQGFGIEFILTGILILVCCGVWDPRNSKFHDSTPLRFGLAVSCLAITGGPFTGASMNPARSFAPALWNVDFADHWIYWFAPILAGVVFTLLFKAVFRREVVEAEKPNNKLRAVEEVPLS